MKKLIVTADDFGAATVVNEAVEKAHVDGVLTAASLMVGAPAVLDAVERARRLPKLGVGLHLVLVEGKPILPPDEIPDLVDRDGLFRRNMVRAGVDIFFRPSVRRQLVREINAQFSAFAATGLKLDHVNAHKHFHLHPTISSLILAIGRRYGLKAMRAPVEPINVLSTIEPVTRHLPDYVAMPWAYGIRKRSVHAGLLVPDQTFGIAWSGHMNPHRMLGLIEHLPEGLSEIYLHPAISDEFEGHAVGYESIEEWHALTDETVKKAIKDQNIVLGNFSDFLGK
ncbi:MAG: hopanoid biosynthesis-associated protein HpnK [Zymomonas mobilis subsp. pomaceae]|uniref:Hopanoid biosynthesis associated protein HpnK n=1 Tax=Zymomonas mobilis subsp. pomaceae (strain ATCC 29192 / DSM 22645 / JCM 10191 / CCUG 17912 / NBRC 13757 / NCIMB 11200 / NRRL B-4491 / Barker I) TaxID=579138 RepID=F8EUI9_ZYMMT|nr:hopanoid biosynthesis-associated protein HpnK [Zymomonas mobilis]AEI37205.1 hopanoid biosynthesis associated protein HpnK [Zymomonas mobilis subsp. pomaceae ATCC 29192]MDX5948575.1 hopanoid biosynthesis-associated protein HpnK [Zymomonas mobilis subsp. pomaceae]GEB88381.1 hypothetical protein ZMO02_00180 [Zymomonas mobilis subsp. pomaceae]